jgi:hypothetical protein
MGTSFSLKQSNLEYTDINARKYYNPKLLPKCPYDYVVITLQLQNKTLSSLKRRISPSLYVSLSLSGQLY